jgi:glyoxylase-like metal-dependent hydrolase (beta-lactamase superfamily II)
MLTVDAGHWYEAVRMGDEITLIHEPWIKPFYRCNMWHVRGRDRDLLFDTGLGHFSLRKHVPLVTGRDIVCVASHTHFDHIGCHHEFPGCCVHEAEAGILTAPDNRRTLATQYATDEMFMRFPEGWDHARYSVRPARPGRLLQHGDTIDLGDRLFDVIHVPGHSPGSIALFERQTGIFLSGDIIYDGPLIDDAYHSDVPTYIETMERLAHLPISIVHGGHFPSFGPTRFRQLIDEYLLGKHAAGCHIPSLQGIGMP